MLEVIEEKVKINGTEFTKSELLDIRQFLTLNNGNYILITSKKVEQTLEIPNGLDAKGNPAFSKVTRQVPIAALVRKSSGMQKALNNSLLKVVGERIVADEFLVDAFSRYKS